MGFIYDLSLYGGKYHIIVKRIIPPPTRSRSFGDERKAASYQVEANFYENVAHKLLSEHHLSLPVPYLIERFRHETNADQITICMSRLKGSPGGLDSDDEIHAVLRWLAALHAATWGEKADFLVDSGGLQPIGSYWHLDTRPEDHDSMPRRGWEGRLKRAARAIDERLKRDPMQCCVHGDAKDANMLFFKGEQNEVCVAMYDFQYCGKAPPSVDLAYFLCVAAGCNDANHEYLDFYRGELVRRLGASDLHPTLKDLQESVALAFCDFQRFMSGWGVWGSDLSSVVIDVLDRLDGGKDLGSEDAYRQAVIREFG